MIRFKILGIGEYLDLPADFGFQFQYNNSVFAFENMALSRSTEFAIPRTPTNDRLLDFAHDPAKFGEATRKSRSVELQYSGGKIAGRLFYGRYTGTYSGVFVYGELEALQRANKYGVLKNFTSFPQVLNTATATLQSAYDINGTLLNSFAFYKYRNTIAEADKLVTGLNTSPVVRLRSLLDTAKTAIGVNVDMSAIGTAKDAIGIILDKQQAAPTLTAVTVSGIPKSTLNFSGTGASNYFALTTVNFKHKAYQSLFWKTQSVKVLLCKRNLKIKFNYKYFGLAVITGDGSTFKSTAFSGALGQNSFRYIKQYEEIEFKTGEYFCLADVDDYDTIKDNWGSPFYDGFSRAIDSDLSITETPGYVTFDVWSGDTATVDLGEMYPLQYNLPDITFVDILKIYANLFRCGINYDATTNTVSFFNFNFDRSQAIDLTDIVIAEKSVDRTFLNYAQKNYIDFKSEDYVKERERTTYEINNESAAEEKTLYTIPFSEGVKSVAGAVEVYDFETVKNEDNSFTYKRKSKQGTICVASKTAGETDLKHISKLYEHFTVGDLLKPIIENSTTVVLQVKMTVKTFLNIRNTDTFKYKGQYFVCITGNHSGNSAELTMVRL